MVREDFESGYGFPYWKKLNTGTGFRTGRNEKRVREDFESRYGFPYWKKLNTGTGSRTLATLIYICIYYTYILIAYTYTEVTTV